MHHIFSWHLNGTLTFPIIGGLDQLLDWEDVLDFIQRAQQASKNIKQDELTTRNSPSMIPTIPVGILIKKTVEKNKNSENLEPNKGDITPIKINKKIRQQTLFDESMSSSSTKNYWVQINNICVPYIIKSEQTRYLPYQVLVDCDLFNEQEQSFLLNFTIKASLNDIQIFERIISSSSSIDFKLNNDLLIIDLYHLIFGMSKVVYVKLLNNQRDVNKGYKTVLAQCGGIVICYSHSIPFITIGKFDYVVFDSLIAVLQLSTKTMSILRRRIVPAQSHEIDYIRLVQFYQQKHNQDDNILSNQQSLISINDIQKYVNENDLIIDQLLTQYQQNQYQHLKKRNRSTGK